MDTVKIIEEIENQIYIEQDVHRKKLLESEVKKLKKRLTKETRELVKSITGLVEKTGSLN